MIPHTCRTEKKKTTLENFVYVGYRNEKNPNLMTNLHYLHFVA